MNTVPSIARGFQATLVPIQAGSQAATAAVSGVFSRISCLGQCQQGRTFTSSSSTSMAQEGSPLAASSPLQHFRRANETHPLSNTVDEEGKPVWINPMDNKVWSDDEVFGVQKTHVDTKSFADTVAYGAVKLLRSGFDVFSGYSFGPINEEKFLRRAIFLETVAGIPGMVAGSVRHLQSLRLMKRDHGWINTLLEEAENERMHLLTFLKLKKPGIIFRNFVLLSQGIFWNMYFFTYIVNPKICHRFVGYLEEEAVKTYTTAIEALESGLMPTWTDKAAPPIAKTYWGLAEDARMIDVLLAIRADEAHHRDVNHTLSDLKPDQTNPYIMEHQRYNTPQSSSPPSPGSPSN